ncbi:MAG: flagellar biosynthetic protein FliO [Candidatus Margulisiibacteriota bacterium]
MDTSYYLKFILSSLFIIGFLLIILKYSKNLQHRTNNNKHLKIIDRMALGSQSNLFLIEVKGNEYLIGATNQTIQLVDKL